MSVKLQDIQQELKLSDQELNQFIQRTGIRVPENVKRIPDKEANRLRSIVRDTRRREEKKMETISLPSLIAVRDFASRLELPTGEIIKQLLKNGVVANLNESLDYETAAIIASDLGYNTQEDVSELEGDVLTPEKLEEILKKEDQSDQVSRPPVVTIMGHVDHGKTTLLDAVREENVAATEAGGITQRISSYQAKKNDKVITFIDTPGHEAFEFMRKRGASLADIGILVVASDDGIMAQTKEAVVHAKAANIPIVVAITKIDLQRADVNKVKRQLAEVDLLPEEYGGDVPVVPVSSVTGEGLQNLLETILLVTEVIELRANPNRSALATVIESRRDSNIGVLASVLVHTGVLRVGDNIVIGKTAGTVRQLLDFNGKPIKEATPSMPVSIIGISGVPEAGDILQVVEERTLARKKAAQMNRVVSHKTPTKDSKGDRDDSTEETEEDEKDLMLTLPIVLNADTHGSLEAIRQAMDSMSTDQVSVKLLRSSVGNITENDVMTAQAANGVIVGFNVNAVPAASRLAEKEGISIQQYSIIYKLTEDIRIRMEEMIPEETVREDLGTIKVLKVFFTIQGKQILGGRVTNGKIRAGEKLEARRGETVVAKGSITELQQNQVSIDYVTSGQECGITYEGEGRIREGDVVTIYHEETRKRQLDS